MKKINLDVFMKENEFTEIYNSSESSFDLNKILNSKELYNLDIKTKNHLLTVLSKYKNEHNNSVPTSNAEELSLKEFLKITENKVNK